MAKRTCLYEAHLALNGKMVDFAGFDMPIQYEGILQEHQATRHAIGLFDVSHMGKFYLKGARAHEAINGLITNNIAAIAIGQAIYSPMCYEDGGTVDDILVYRLGETDFMLVVNAANKDKDFDWISLYLQRNYTELILLDDTDHLCQIALQGPKSTILLNTLVNESLDDLPYYSFRDKIILDEVELLISRTGYTGEDGYELYFDSKYALKLWHYLLDKGASYGIKPCGLGARDTLRFEAGMPLYGNELSADINPLEAGLAYFVKLDKGTFVGKEALKRYKAAPQRKLVGFRLIDRGMARHGTDVIDTEGKLIGSVTTGYKSPSYGDTLGFALIPADYSENTLTLAVRKKKLTAEIINRRFIKSYQTT